MPVDQATYRPYNGPRQPGRRIARAIGGTMIRKLRRNVMVRAFVYGVPVLTSLIAVVVFAFFYENESKLPRMFREIDLQQAFSRMIVDSGFLWFLALMTAALVGGPLIAEDRRAKALPLYFSRPVTHFRYVLGKMIALCFFLGLMLVGPVVLMFVADVVLNPKTGQLSSQLSTLGNALVPTCARVLSLSAVILGVSALSRRSNHAALLFFGIVLPAEVVARVFARRVFHDASWLAISPKESIDRIAMDYLPAKFEADVFTASMSVGTAWTGLCIWTAAGLIVLALCIRKVEVVT